MEAMQEQLQQYFREALLDVETQLKLNDRGWVQLGTSPEQLGFKRTEAVQQSRLYWAGDPLAKQAIRLWTDYAFGTGVQWKAADDKASAALTDLVDSPRNASVFSPRGQRMGSDKLLIDGEVFIALFPGKQPIVRYIDPLQITELVTNPDDYADVRYFKREWSTPQGQVKTVYYRSWLNPDNVPIQDAGGRSIRSTEEAILYHLPVNTIASRGVPLLYPAIDWIRLHRRFLAARVAVMLAAARFVWNLKVQGNQAQVEQVAKQYEDNPPPAGSMHVENATAGLQSIRADTGAQQAYNDGRMIKLMVSAATGWPEQYFGDISIGNLATAQTVELPVQKMCQSYQAVWGGVYRDIFNTVFGFQKVEKRYVDIDFPPITPTSAGVIADAFSKILPQFPAFVESPDVQQQALMALGITNTKDAMETLENVLASLEKEEPEPAPTEVPPPGEVPTEEQDPALRLSLALREFRRKVVEGGNGHHGLP